MAYAKIHNVLIHHEMCIFEKTSSESDKKKNTRMRTLALIGSMEIWIYYKG